MKGLNLILQNDWQELLKEEINKTYFVNLKQFLQEEYETKTIYPPVNSIFQALNETPYSEVKVVILGQDPYHGEGQAHGLSFSVQPGVKHPPSLRNLFIELENDEGCIPPKDGTLLSWSEQGVLLLNTVLTVRKGEANSHKGKGWEIFTDEVIKKLNHHPEPVVFFLWGKHAQEKKKMIDSNKHLIIESPHPSPFSARKGFFGSKPFSKANEFLRKHNRGEIHWCLNK